MRGPNLRLALLGGALATTMIAALIHYGSAANTAETPARMAILVGFSVVGVAIYILAVLLILRGPMPRASLWIVLGVAALMRVVFLPSPPFLSSDIYRYIWDGQVQAAGINPYRYVPADPALARLHDPDIYPNVNRADYARTIYPPAAQMVFAIVGQVTSSVIGMKAAMLCFEAVAIACLLRVLSLAGLPRERILIYAWNPLPLWSFACDGHVDAIAIGFVGLGLLARAKRRDGTAGALLALATLAKFLPVVIAPAFVRGARFWQPAIVGVTVILAAYLVYATAGAHVLGFLGGYEGEEGYDTGRGYWLLAGLSRLVALPSFAGRVYMLLVAVAFAGLALWVARGRRHDDTPDAVALCRDSAILGAFATAAVNPHYAWYYAWLALPCVVSPIPAVIWLSSSAVLLYIDPFNERFLWPALVFVPALALTIRSLWRHRSPFQRVVPA